MERRDFFIDDIEKIGAMVARLLGFRALKRTPEHQQEINNGLAELFGLDLDKMAFEESVSKIKAIENPQKLDYLVQLLTLEMENEKLSENQLSIRKQLLNRVENEMETKYSAQKTTTFFRQINSPK